MTETAESLKNTGNLHVQQGDLVAAEAAYRAALAIDDCYIPAWNNLGNVLYSLNRMPDSIAAFERAVALKPDHATSLFGLANALVAEGRPVEAFPYAQKAVQSEPSSGTAFNTLGRILHQLDRCEESCAAYAKAIQLNPTSAETCNGLGNVLKEMGKLSDALAAYRQGISLLIQQSNARQPRPKDYMDVAEAGDALIALKNALDEEGIPFFLAYGTLLGIVRDGELLPHDKDMDVGLFWNVDRKDLLNKLTEKHGFVDPTAHLDMAKQHEWSMTLRHPANDIAIDLFFFKLDGESLLSGFAHEPTPLLWRFSVFETESFEYLGASWQVPTPPEQFLQEIYGDGWKKPDPYFDSIVSGLNRVPEAQEVALCYAYNRLYERISRSEWEKAKGYCRQILACAQDSFIEEVNGWLEKIK